jgi:hypothetical protein
MRVRGPSAILISAVLAVLTMSAPAAATDRAIEQFPSLLLRVTDAASGRPIDDAEVLVSFIGGDVNHPYVVGSVYGTTNGGGHVLFKGLPSGTAVVSVTADGHVSFGNGAEGDRLPTGASIVIGAYRGGAGASGNVPVRLAIELLPLLCWPNCSRDAA